MATWVVGDVQGCKKPLKRLLEKIAFSWQRDRLWLAGDVVNRGPRCLKTLRFLHKHQDRVTVVLGNHDLHLLAVAAGARKATRSDTLKAILAAPDRHELLGWLKQQPLAHLEADHLLVHAGIPPQWTPTQALALSAEVSEVVQSDDSVVFLKAMYGNEPKQWSFTLEGFDRLRLVTNYLTRMRYCTAEGELDLASKGPPKAPGGPAADDPRFKPWFVHEPVLPRRERIVFGHWASLQGRTNDRRYIALDTGCVWGQALTAYCIESGDRISVSCRDKG